MLSRFLPALLCPVIVCACASRAKEQTLSWHTTEPRVDLRKYVSVQKRPGQRSDIAVAVAISGGGMRAANFAAGALTALENVKVRGTGGKESNLLREVDYFSTASGGGFAAISYLSHLQAHKEANPADRTGEQFNFAARGAMATMQDTSESNWRRALSRNYQASIIRALFNPLLLGRINRGDVLQARLDDYVAGSKRRGKPLTLGDVFIPVGSGKVPTLPYWVANATVYENGAIFPFTPDMLEVYGVKGYRHQENDHQLTSPYDLPLSVGLKASASFPVAIPATSLSSGMDDKHPNLHLMDGGVADNLGIMTAVRLLLQDPAKKKVLILIDAYNGIGEPFSRPGLSPGIFRTAFRTTTISLDSAHQRADNLLGLLEETKGLRSAIIDFHQAVTEQAANQPTVAEQKEMVAMQASSQDRTSELSIDSVLKQAIGIGTSLKVSGKKQDTLIKAGENAVYQAKSTNEQRLLSRLAGIKALF